MNRDMDFIIGILTGAFLMLTWGYYLNRKTKKELADAEAERIFQAWRKEFNPQPASKPPYLMNYKEQLKQALESEDYEKAAQLRDLIKKQ